MQWQLSECYDSSVGIGAWNKQVVVRGNIVYYEPLIGNRSYLHFRGKLKCLTALPICAKNILYSASKMISEPSGSVLNSYRVQGYRHKVQRPNEIRGKIFCLQFPAYGTTGMHCSTQKASLAMYIPFLKAQPGSLSWFEVTEKWWGSDAGGLGMGSNIPPHR